MGEEVEGWQFLGGAMTQEKRESGYFGERISDIEALEYGEQEVK
jgi:hypothetical protein